MVSTKGRYAIRFLIDLAEQGTDTRVPLDDIAERQGISKKYLEIIVKLLVNGKMVKGFSGKGGGYCLTKPANEYTVAEVLELTEGTLAPVACLMCDAEKCPREDYCKTLPMWKKYYEMEEQFFKNITIADLVNGRV